MNRLENLAEKFRDELIQTFLAFTGERPCLEIGTMRDRVVIKNRASQNRKDGLITIRRGNSDFLGIAVQYHCMLNDTSEFLTVEKSKIAIYPLAQSRREPLFRVEYVRSTHPGVPSSHIQVHGHRDEMTALMLLSGHSSKTAKSRSTRDIGDKTPQLSEFHFPTGGPRFRPTLEIVLEVIRNEFGLEKSPQWKEHFQTSQHRWARIQAATVIADYPDIALEILKKKFGLEVPPNFSLSASESPRSACL